MINAYLTDTVEIIEQTKDEWNEPTGETATTVPARILYKTKRILTSAGEEVQSERSAMIQDRALDHGALLEIDGIRWAILKIEKPRDFTWNFIEIFLGKA